MAAYFPLWLDIQNRRCVVIGGGKVAERKVFALLGCQAEVIVISPEITPAIEVCACSGDILLYRRQYASGDLDKAWLVFAATGNSRINQSVADTCFTLGIPVNVVDAPESGSFLLPAVLRQGSLNIGISTEGKSPLFAQRLRDALERVLGPEYGEFVDWLGERRKEIQTREKDIDKRRKAYEAALECLDFDFAGPQASEYKERIRACISSYPE